MKALINFKICDNSIECSGIEVCPTKAMYFDNNLNTIVVDEDKCINCGLCQKACPVGAILVAKNEEEYNKYIKDIENDPRTVKDLFVDRYGAAPISNLVLGKNKDLDEKIKKNDLIFIEIFDFDTLNCLSKSIPITEITGIFNRVIPYYRIDKDDRFGKRYKVKEYPSLLVFSKGKLIGKIEGLFEISNREILEEKLKSIVS